MLKFLIHKAILLFLCLTCAHLSSAQNKKQIVLSGIVFTDSLKPLPDAYLTNLKTQRVSYSDNSGRFFLKLSSQPTVIQVSHVGYSSIQKEIGFSELNQLINDTLFLDFRLKRSSLDLETVEISSEEKTLAYKYNIRLKDFDIYNGNLLLLLEKSKQNKIRLVTHNSQTLSEITVPARPLELFKDCFDKLHILYKDSMRQVLFNSQKLALSKASPISKYKEYLEPCRASYKEDLAIFQRFEAFNRATSYSLINNGSAKVIFQAADVEEIEALEASQNSLLARESTTPSTMGDNNALEQKAARKLDHDQTSFERTIKRKIYLPLFKIKDSIFIFNCLADTAYVLDQNGKQSRSFPISFHHLRSWEKKLHTDTQTGKIYSLHKERNHFYLCQIDLTSGNLTKKFKIRNHAFPENIKIWDETVYYFYRDPYSQNTNKRIYKQRIQ